ncbi:MAG: flagellar export chaperone FliS [Pyrinomonadaceae bacterium]
MYAQPKGISSYGRQANTETDPIRQVVMLYDGAIKFLNLTALDMEAGDVVAKGEHSRRALDILTYLQSILDFEKGQDVAVNLDNLYRNITAMVLKASAKTDAKMMRQAGDLLVPVRDAWQVNAGRSIAPANAAGGGFAMVG